MKIYYKDVLSNKEGVHKEILNTTNSEIFKTETREDEQDNLWEVESEFRKISDVFESVKSKLIEDFNIEEDEY